MKRFAILLPVLIAMANPAVAEESGATPPAVVILRGSSAPPTPWYEPPPEPQVIIQPVYVPLYYLPVAYGPTFNRQPHWHSARRNR